MPMPDVRPLYEWQSPSSLLALSDALSDCLGWDFLISNGNEAKTVREAWVASRFALSAFPDRSVRMHAGAKFDFEIEGDPPLPCEVTEALDKGRKRTEEYKAARTAAEIGEKPETHSDAEDWRRNADNALGALTAAVSKKAAKPYPPGTNLVVYLNIETYGVGREGIEAGLVDAVRGGGNSFAAIWVYWNDRLYRCHPEPLEEYR